MAAQLKIHVDEQTVFCTVVVTKLATCLDNLAVNYISLLKLPKQSQLSTLNLSATLKVTKEEETGHI